MHYLSHAGDTHHSATTAGLHFAATEWYIALPLIVVALALLGFIATKVFRAKSAGFLTVTAGLFVAGVSLYSLSPVTSTICLTVGFAAVLIQVLGSQGGPDKAT